MHSDPGFAEVRRIMPGDAEVIHSSNTPLPTGANMLVKLKKFSPNVVDFLLKSARVEASSQPRFAAIEFSCKHRG